MNTYGKPTYQWYGFYKLIREVRQETGHIYDTLYPNDGLEEIYKESRTKAEFKKRMIKHLGWDKK